MTLWDAVTWIGHRLRRFFTRRPAKYSAVHVTEMPDTVDDRVVYVGGEGEHRWFAAFRCPCGCGELVQLSLHPDGRPQWRVREHEDGTVSVWPSVNRTRGCESHFWLKVGMVRWLGQ
jgi:hypothetical protein